METQIEYQKVSDIVLKLLETDYRCRVDNKWLTYKVFREFTQIFIPFDDFIKIPSFETAARCKRKILETRHDLRVNDEKRYNKAEEVKEIMLQ